MMRSPLFDTLSSRPPDGLLALIGLFANDPRPHKIDLGMGVYKDDAGLTPVMSAVKQAEAQLLKSQTTKSYLGAAGDTGFVDHLIPLVFGLEREPGQFIGGIQTPGGTGALKLAAELIGMSSELTKVWVCDPTWINHLPILQGANLTLIEYPYFDQFSQTLQFEAMCTALSGALPGDAVLLHGACHNPTGADLDDAQWSQLTDIITDRALMPLIDIAYHGLGAGLDADMSPIKRLLKRVPEALICYSCDKNFGLYRERVGSIFYQSNDRDRLERMRANLLAHSRAIWSMPPDHGAAIVRTILTSSELTEVWRRELDEMRQRIQALRQTLAAGHSRLEPLASQNGMFSLLPLTLEDVLSLREDHGVYMVASGRANLAGLQLSQVGPLIEALKPHL